MATFLRGDIEVPEFEIKSDSPAANKKIADLHLPKEALIGAVLAPGGAEIGRGATTLKPGDRVVLLASPPRSPRPRTSPDDTLSLCTQQSGRRRATNAEVLMKHYAKSRHSADYRAADHLGSVVHSLG